MTFRKSEVLRISADRKSSEKTVSSLFKEAAEFLKIPMEKISGDVSMKSDIPMKTGLGSSAAVCVNVANICGHCGMCDDVLGLARHLENKFHRKSSGLDVTVAFENRPIIFEQNKLSEFLYPSFWPPMVLTYSGEKSITHDCVTKIGEIFSNNEKLALELDEQMNSASNLCEEALKRSDFSKLKEGIALGGEVFGRWGLCNSSMSAHMEKLLSSGARAAKPIGSGLGGYILSLWEENPVGILRNLPMRYPYLPIYSPAMAAAPLLP
jgi:mevalonate kinase